MNRLTYTIKAFYLLGKRIVNGQAMPFHKKEMSYQECRKPENKKYMHNGILRTAKFIIKGECKLHWLRD
jgi:hypothetical protein